MSLNINNNVYNLLINHLIVFLVFVCLHMTVHHFDKNAYNNANDLLDFSYFTMTTQSTSGFGDITPKTRTAKIVTMLHQMCIIFMSINFIYLVSVYSADQLKTTQ
jgi:high-affinity Fe2+/Pb2+ permease